MKKAVVLLLAMTFILLPCLSFAGKEYETEGQLNAEEELVAEEQLEPNEQLETDEELETEEPKAEVQHDLPVVKVKTGFGYGIPYGMVGVNIEAMPNNHLAILAGGGFLQGVPCFSTGFRGYALPRNAIVRPRITVLYGTVRLLEKNEYNYSTYKASRTRDPLYGTAVGVGFSWQFSARWGIDFDVLQLFYRQPAETPKENSNTKYSVGFGYYFKTKKAGLVKSKHPEISQAEEDLGTEEYETEGFKPEKLPALPLANTRIGVGLGIPYGMLGVGFEGLLNDYISILLGAGGYQEVFGFALGGRGYVLPRSSKFRPRLTFLYGTVGILTKTTYTHYNKSTTSDSIKGTALGVGFSWKYSPNWGMDLDILCPFYSRPGGASQTGGTLKISLGLGYYFYSIVKKGSFRKK